MQNSRFVLLARVMAVLGVIALVTVGYQLRNDFRDLNPLKGGANVNQGPVCENGSTWPISEIRSYFDGFEAQGRLDGGATLVGGQSPVTVRLRLTDTNKVVAEIENDTDCRFKVSLAVYKMYDRKLSTQTYYGGQDGVLVTPFSTTRVQTNLPSCMAQVDLYAAGSAPRKLVDGEPWGLSGQYVDSVAFLGWGHWKNNGQGVVDASGPFCSTTTTPPPSQTPPPPVAKECKLILEKSVNPANANPGQEVEFVINIRNGGNLTCTGGGVHVQDVYDSRLTYVSETHSSNIEAGYQGTALHQKSQRTLNWNAFDLEPSETGWIRWKAKVPSTVPACTSIEIPNTAKATADQYDNMTRWAESNIAKVTVAGNCAPPPPVAPPPPAPNPPPPPASLVCTPSSQNVLVNANTNFSATGGNGVYSWAAPSGSVPRTGSGSAFTTKFGTAGSYQVAVTSGTQTANCAVTVRTQVSPPPPVNPPPPVTPPPPAPNPPPPVTPPPPVVPPPPVTPPPPAPNPPPPGGGGGGPTLLDVGVIKKAEPTSLLVGQEVTFTMTVTNYGSPSASGLSFLDKLPLDTQFVSATASKGTYDANTGMWVIGDLGANLNATLKIIARVTASGTKINQISLQNVQPGDYNSSNNSASAAVTAVSPSPAPLVCAPGSQNVQSGQNVSFVAAGGSGSYSWSAPSSTQVTATGSTFVTSYNNTGNYSVTVTSGASAATCNVVVAGVLTETDVKFADLALTKSVSPGEVYTGDSAVFTVNVSNQGNLTAPLVSVKDVLPGGLALVSHSASNGVYDIGTGIWSIGELGIGQTASLLLVVRSDAAGTYINSAEIYTAGVTDTDSTPGNGVAGEDDIGMATLNVKPRGALPPAGFPVGIQLAISGLALVGVTTFIMLRRKSFKRVKISS